MADLPKARNSPRIVNGVLKWYVGDTFDYQLTLKLKDQDGESITILTTDTVTVIFLDKSLNTVKTFTFTEVANNTVTLDFDSTATALFSRGKYTYDVCLTHSGERTTVANDCPVIVE